MSRVLTFPLRLLGRLGYLAVVVLAKLFGPLLNSADSSQWLSERIDTLSSALATRRGVPILIGTGFVIASFVAHGIVIVLLVSTESLYGSLYWLCIPFTLLHVGLLTGFIGIMMATPLGQGYKDK